MFSVIFINKSFDFSTKSVFSKEKTCITYDFTICLLLVLTKKNKTMNKSELIDAIAKDAKITKVEAGKVLDATTTAITKALKKGDRVALIGFGSFSISKRAARTGRNPQTGKAIKIAAKKVAKFKAGAVLAKAVK